MTTSTETTATADEAAVYATLPLAFNGNPATRWTIDGPEIMRQMAFHHPQKPHWYLPLLGVDPGDRGAGLGSALLRYATGLFDGDDAVAHLDSSNPRNVPLYERRGFEIIGRVRSGGSPVFTPMVCRSKRQ